MNENLQNAITNIRITGAELETVSGKSHAAERELNTLRDQLATLEAAVSSAENAHAIAEAARQLGEGESDPAMTASALHDARDALLADAPGLRDKIRAASLVVEKLGARALEASAKHTAAMTVFRTAQNESLTEKLQLEIADAIVMVEKMAAANERISALNELLRERGAPWQGGPGARLDRVMHQDTAAIARHRAALMAELSAAA